MPTPHAWITTKTSGTSGATSSSSFATRPQKHIPSSTDLKITGAPNVWQRSISELTRPTRTAFKMPERTAALAHLAAIRLPLPPSPRLTLFSQQQQRLPRCDAGRQRRTRQRTCRWSQLSPPTTSFSRIFLSVF
ncbi:hypothetical protein BDV98DRAFT_572775 [Pterulicium gracile]|uniref:Uncharacterized protein n=1 Tax=Pterulicium gracile TaxID=1884261 RepID=A0A5C3Q9R9_9AGAR|nr:hypothetical protein BDV98DRAFT_572775 [Pterula gracilis]